MNKSLNIGIPVDLNKLIDTRAIIQAGSGGGKSYTIRKISETIGNSVQQIILDLEGEFVSLREKFDFALVSKDGDIPLSVRYAEVLAHKLLETSLSAIIDLSELKHHDRILFVKKFSNALIDSPKESWHPCVIVVDEAHIFCPETGKAESMSAIIDLCTRGRKRGFATILATQRLSKLHKDAAAECLNKLIGRTGLDIDRKRAADELGVTNKQDVIKLRELEPGEFYAFGPAISNEVRKFKVGKVVTSHPKSGHGVVAPPKTPNAVKKILSKLADIPEEAEKELNTRQELQAEIARLKSELRKQSASKKDIALAPPNKEEIKELQRLLNGERKTVQKFSEELELFRKNFSKQMIELNKLHEKVPILFREKSAPIILPPAKVITKQYGNGAIEKMIIDLPPSSASGEMRMLKAAAKFYPNPISRTQMGVWAKMSSKSGSFSTYLSRLKQSGLITGDKNLFEITEQGLKTAGTVEPLPDNPDELVNAWCSILGEGSGAARILKKLAENYPHEVDKTELGEMTSMSSTSGSFATYLSRLKGNGLIKSNGQNIKASDELFNN